MKLFICAMIAMIGLSPGLLAKDKRFYSYGELQSMDLEQMRSMVQTAIRKSKLATTDIQPGKEDMADQQAIELLRESLILVLSRPNRDNVVEKLIPPVRLELKSHNSFYDTLGSVVDEAMRGLKQGSLPTVKRVTYLIVLENFMAEFRPDINRKSDIKSIFKRLQKAELEVPERVANERKLRTMEASVNPSKLAKEILEQAKKAKRKKDKAKKK